MKMSPIYTDIYFKTTLSKNERGVRSENLNVNELVIVQQYRKRARRTKENRNRLTNTGTVASSGG